jgi:AAA domain-containing protein
MTPPVGVGVPRRQIVIVSGAPGSGKTTLAVPLAEALGFPLLAKDHIKEALFDALGATPGDLAVSRRIVGGAAMEVIWTLAARVARAVLEANSGRTAATRGRGCRGSRLGSSRKPVSAGSVSPIGVGETMEVDTSAPVDGDAAVGRVRRALAA